MAEDEGRQPAAVRHPRPRKASRNSTGANVCSTARIDSAKVLAKWTALTTIDLAALNAKLKAVGQPAVALPKR